MFITAYAGGATDKGVTVWGYTASTGLPYTGGAYNTSGITAKYRRHGANAEVTITLATQTANGAHTDGGFVHVSGGTYRLDLPDAAIASSADYVDIWVYGVTDVVFTPAHVDILGADPRAASVTPDAASIRSAVGLASANLDTQLSTIDTVVDRIEVDTQDLQTQVGTDGAGLTALPWNAAWDAEVQSECTDALNAYDPPTRAELTSDVNAIPAAVLSAAASDPIDANVEQINTVPVTGNGVSPKFGV